MPLAYVSTPFIGILFRQRLATKAVANRLPYWSVSSEEAERGERNSLDDSLMRSADILLNALALLAYTSSESLYKSWRVQFDLDAVASWLVEQQSSNQHFENAIVSGLFKKLFTDIL